MHSDKMDITLQTLQQHWSTMLSKKVKEDNRKKIVSTPLNLVFGIWEFNIDLRVSLFLGLVVTSVNTLLVFGTYWD